MISRKRVILSLAMLLIAAFTLRSEAIDDYIASPAINAPKTAVLVIDLKTGRELVSHNADTPLIPASIMKCVTTATLLDKTGSRYRYSTPVYYTGRLRNGVIEGDIVVQASADPSINTAHEPGSADLVSEIVEALRALRVDSVAGSVIVDETDFPGPAINPTWASGDLPHAYGTGTHGFNFEDNASGKKSVNNPAGIFKSRLRTSMQRAGIRLGNNSLNSPSQKHNLLTHKSELIDEIMRSCMMRSDNQFAEALMRTIGYEYGGVGSTERGTQETLRHWKRRGAATDGIKIVDGSGLSRSNRVTARFMAEVLKQSAGDPYYASFFPLAGMEGTLKKFLQGTALEGEIAMKTGSMNGIQCYAGYKLDGDYAPTHLVVVIMNEMQNRAAARTATEKLLVETFAE